MHLAQVAAHAAQLCRVVGALAHDDHRPSRELGAQAGQTLTVEDQRLLTAQELGAVVGQRLQLAGHAGPGGVELVGHVVPGHLATLRDDLVTDQDGPTDDPDAPPVGDRRERVHPADPAEAVDHGDTGVGEDLRTTVGEPAGDHLRPVEHGDHSGLDEGVGRRAVEVHLVEQSDLARREPRQQRRRTTVGAGGADDA